MVSSRSREPLGNDVEPLFDAAGDSLAVEVSGDMLTGRLSLRTGSASIFKHLAHEPPQVRERRLGPAMAAEDPGLLPGRLGDISFVAIDQVGVVVVHELQV